jgi:hypothetical protein
MSVDASTCFCDRPYMVYVTHSEVSGSMVHSSLNNDLFIAQ